MTGSMNFGFLSHTPAPPKGRRVAVVGAGPSGLSAAGYLARWGYEVEVLDKMPKAGGLMVFGIPGHRIPPERIEQGVRDLEERLGVRFRLETKISGCKPLHEDTGDHFCSDMVSLGELTQEFDAVLICTGTWKSRKLNIPGEGLSGVMSGLEFLFPIRAARYDKHRVQQVDARDKRVAVIGAGHSAVDVVEGALKQKASKVVMMYRRTRREAPCGSGEIETLQAAGAEWMELVSPLRILGEQQVEGIEVTRCRLGSPDPSGRCRFVPVENGNLTIDVDLVITAIGEIPTAPFAAELGLDTVRKGDIHWLQMTSQEGIFVAGDVLSGPSKIGRAVYSGLRAARSLSSWLSLKDQNREDEYNYDDDFVGKGEL